MRVVSRTTNTIIAAPVVRPLPIKEGNSASRVRQVFPGLFTGWTRASAAARVVALMPLISN